MFGRSNRHSTGKSAHIKTRRPHERSRLGCIRCKKSHVRCDETKPSCLRCLGRGMDCRYYVVPGAPGMQATWRVDMRILPKPPTNSVDCMPIRMPYKSCELLHHCMCKYIPSD
ncbi:hypothetical protein BX600DRAFT_229174 [Xylariales sp. PMI_506]|nr:hypothetical protein BX600DRAFT_229174 [Xylariales sp. PMI_506]